MKNNLLILTIISIAGITLNACKKPVSQLALYVPKDATIVVTIDTKAISNKIASSGITIDSLANLFESQKDKYALRWNDIKNSGIDLSKSLYIFSKTINSIQRGNIQNGGLVAEVQDAKKLEAFFKKERIDGEVLSGGKYKYIALGDDYVAGWTDKILIISFVSGGTSAPGKYSTGEGTLSQQQLTTLFTQNESASLASIGEFRDVVAKPGDIHFYTNASASLNTAAMPGMTRVNDLLEDCYTEGVVNFENGKAVVASESHYNKTLSDIIDKYSSKEIIAGLVKNYPDSLSGFAIVSFDPKVLIDILRYLGFDTMADSFVSNLGFTTNDVVNAFSGDIAIMFSPRSKDNISSHDPGFLLNLIIGDKTAFNKVLNGLVNKQILTKSGDEYQLGIAGGHGFVIEPGDNSLFVSSSGEIIKAYQPPSKNSMLPADIEKQITNKTSAFYVDIASLIGNKSIKDSVADMHAHDSYYVMNISKAAKETFKNVIATSDKSEKRIVKGNMQLNFVNPNENSLAGLAKFMAFAHEEELKNKTNNPEIFIDSIPQAKDSSNN